MQSFPKNILKSFVAKWRAAKGYEKGETHQFWLQLLRELGYPQVDEVLFEHHLPSGGYLDVWLKEANVLVEQKSADVDLDKAEPRQGKLKTPLEQALDYVEELPRTVQPRFVVVCNFRQFRVYDRDEWGRSQLVQHAFEFTLDELEEHPEYLSFIVDPRNSRLEKEKTVSIQAGELIGKLYDMLRKGYQDPDSPESMHALNVLCVRLVFCLYCEDAGLFPKDAFYNYLVNIPASFVHVALERLFKALDTEIKDRKHSDSDLKPFPYVNGGLFHGQFEIPSFNETTRRFLLDKVSKPVDWSKISPTIFGGIFESTLNPETRRSGGMHYTSPENIHKVIDPLFLNDLTAEFVAIRDEEGVTPNKRKFNLERFHKKLCSLKFFDPACGSGNFLTETYLCLRQLEDKVLRALWNQQTNMGFHNEESVGDRVNLGQFYGIEINDFAVTVAETALWISRLKANAENSIFYESGGDDFPLHEAANITLGNALRIDWNDVLPAEECSFIMGNPPFVGASMCSNEQKNDIVDLYTINGTEKVKLANSLDYVAGWYYKSCQMIQNNNHIRVAFVSTNSITQGEQVYPIWHTLMGRFGIKIDFAWKTFIWNSEATEKAHVHVVIIGFSSEKLNVSKRLFMSNGVVVTPQNINPYLIDAPNVIASSRARPLFSNCPIMKNGSKPTDGGWYLFTEDEMKAFVSKEPKSERFFRPWLGSDEFINNTCRWCLYLGDVKPEEIADMPLVLERVEAVRKVRLGIGANSKGKKDSKLPPEPTIKSAERPMTFFCDNVQSNPYLIIPKVSGERRLYVPIGFSQPKVISSDLVAIAENATLYDFGVITSQSHMAWMRVVCGRLKSDYRYTPQLVYNNFIWPEPTEEQRQRIETCAQAVLDARASHSGDSLAQMYDGISPMPENPSKSDLAKYDQRKYDGLRAAHHALDAAVESAYGVDFNGDEEKIVAHLFQLYALKTSVE